MKQVLLAIIMALMIPVAMATTVSITPDPAYVDSTLKCDVSGTASYDYYWYDENGNLLDSETNVKKHTLDSSVDFEKGDEIDCEAFKPATGWTFPKFIGSDTITISNSCPIFSSQTSDKIAYEGNLLTFTHSKATDADGDTITYDIQSGPHDDYDNRDYEWTPDYTDAGKHTVVFIADDGECETEMEVDITVKDVHQNTAPELDYIANKYIFETETLLIDANANDDDGDTLTYSYSSTDLPASEVTFNSATGVLEWTTDYDDEGVYFATISVSDGNGGQDSQEVQITVLNKNRAPILAFIGTRDVDELDSLEFAIFADDPDNDPVTYRATNLEPWMSFSAQTFKAAPPAASAGTYFVTFEVQDTHGDKDSETVAIVVHPTNSCPVFRDTPSQYGEEGELLSFVHKVAVDPDGDTITYSVKSAPAGYTYSSTSREFSWTPGFDDAGDHFVVFEASDGVCSDEEKVKLRIANVNRAPVINDLGDLRVLAGNTVTFTVSGNDPDGDTLTFDVTGLPFGATFNANTGLFEWNTDLGDLGDHGLTFFVEDTHGAKDSDDMTITVYTDKKPECSDDKDNDGDGYTDYPNDPGCKDKDDDDESDNPQCSDGKDNDGDGLIDYPYDPGCDSKHDDDEYNPPQCDDGKDNDYDGYVDYPNDPGCKDKYDDDESDNPQCSDKKDNDGDGLIDYPYDPGCDDKHDDDEYNPPQCDDGIDNDKDGKTDYPYDPGCDSKHDDDESDDPQCFDGKDNDYDGYVDYPEDPGCDDKHDDDESNDPQCSDRKDNDGDGLIDYPYDPGCDDKHDDDEYNPPQCDDGIDNDKDGYIDWPHDPGCDDKHDNDESDDPNKPPFVRITNPTIDTTVEQGDMLDLQGLATDDDGTIVSYLWDFDGGATNVFVEDPGLTEFSLVGTFDVIFTATDDDGASSSDAVLITVKAKPECRDGIDNDGDGDIDYPEDRGCSTPDDDDESDDPNLPPKAMIDTPSSDITIEEGNNVHFTGTGTDDDGTITSYHWNFDGGAPSETVEDPADVAFSNPGVYNVVFTVTDNDGAQDTDTVTVTVTEKPNLPPEVTIDTPVTDVTIEEGESVHFTGTATDDDGTIDSYLWNFQGGATNLNVEDPGDVTFNTPGTYGVVFSATDNDGASDSDSVQVTVTKLPECRDGVDNDGDGRTDYPDDPGCDDEDDDNEGDDPACFDGRDNDGDNWVDFPEDPGCESEDDDNEYNVDSDTAERDWTPSGVKELVFREIALIDGDSYASDNCRARFGTPGAGATANSLGCISLQRGVNPLHLWLDVYNPNSRNGKNADKFDNIVYTVDILDIGVRRSIGPINLEPKRSVAEELILDIPENVPTGTYYLRISVHNELTSRTTFREIDIVQPEPVQQQAPVPTGNAVFTSYVNPAPVQSVQNTDAACPAVLEGDSVMDRFAKWLTCLINGL